MASSRKLKTVKSGAVIAAAAATLVLAGCATHQSSTAASQAGPVKCAGTHRCKGQSECKTANSACKGQNSCKGQGWVYAKSAKQCTGKGGKVLAAGDSKAQAMAAESSNAKNVAKIDDSKFYRK